MPSPVEITAQSAQNLNNSIFSYFIETSYNRQYIGTETSPDILRSLLFKAENVLHDLIQPINNLKDDILALDDFGYWYADVDLTNLANSIITDVDAQGRAAQISMRGIIDYITDRTNAVINAIRPNLALDITDIENTIRQETARTAETVTQAVQNAREAVQNEVRLAEKYTIDASTSIIKTLEADIETAAAKTRDIFAAVSLDVRGFLKDAPDDIARRIWEYFRDFVFVKAE